MGDDDAELQLALRLSLEQQNIPATQSERPLRDLESTNHLPAPMSTSSGAAAACSAAAAASPAEGESASMTVCTDGGDSVQQQHRLDGKAQAAAAAAAEKPVGSKKRPAASTPNSAAKLAKTAGGGASASSAPEAAVQPGAGATEFLRGLFADKFAAALASRWGAFVPRKQLAERELLAVLVDTRRALGDPMGSAEQQASLRHRAGRPDLALAAASSNDGSALAELLYPLGSTSVVRASVLELRPAASAAPTAATAAARAKSPTTVGATTEAAAVCSGVQAGVGAGGEAPPEPAPGKKKKKKTNRCAVCRKKVGLTGFTCKCGGMHCGQHRYSGAHSCSYDYKADNQALLLKRGQEEASLKPKKLARI